MYSFRHVRSICAVLTAFLATGIAGMAVSAGPVAASDNVVIQWDNAMLAAIRDTKPGPVMVARDLAIVHTSIYDAWSAYDAVAVGTRLGGSLRRPATERTLENKSKAISFAAYRALVDLFPQPAEIARFNGLMNTLGYNPTDTSLDPATPSGVGNTAAAALLSFRHHDGSNQLGDLHPGAYSDYTGYVPVNDPDHIVDPNRWQPLRVSDGKGGFVVQKFLAPHWGHVIPFALEDGAAFRPKFLPYMYGFGRTGTRSDMYSTQMYIRQAQQLVDISANLTDSQKMIAEYWADGPSSELPPGHWCLIGQYVSRRDSHTLDDDAKMFFAIGNAVMDAGIAAWDCKRNFDYVRPITAIHFLFKDKWIRAWGGPGKGTRWIKGQDWKPYQLPTVVTPAFAECVSGHSTFSASASEVLRLFTGSDYYGASVTFPAGSSKFEPNLPAHPVNLHWDTFTDAANEAGLSRLYGGIHFANGDQPGRIMGRKIGAVVFGHAQAYWSGLVPTD